MTQKRECFLVLDVGSGSGRALLFDTEGKQLGVRQEEWTHPRLAGFAGGFEFRCPENWELLKRCIRQVITATGVDPGAIAAVSAAAQRPGIVCYDSQGKELTAWPCFDARADAETEWIIEQGFGPKIYEINGDWPSIHEPARLIWLKRNHPKIFEKVSRMTMLDGWVLYRLTGERVAEPTIASFSGMFDIRRRSWSQEIMRMLQLPEEILPAVANAGTIMGHVTTQASKETGLAKDTPVILGGGDSQLALLGAGLAQEGAGIVAGTFWVEGQIVETPKVDTQGRQTRTFCHSLSDRWVVEAANFNGILARWFRDVFADEEAKLAAETGSSAYEILSKQASRVPPGSNGIQMCFSALFNSARWIHTPPAMMGWDVFDSAKSSKGAFWRAVLENTCYLAKGELDLIQNVSGVRIDSVVFCGGAAKSSLWQQILADVLGIDVVVPEVVETTALGAAMCAAVGAGKADSLAQAARSMSPNKKSIEPNPSNTDCYEREYRRWLKISSHVFDLVERGIVSPMWAAPATRVKLMEQQTS